MAPRSPRYGRIGTDGQQSLEEYGSEAQAEREYEKLVAEKTKKGYVER
jgi:predicted DNA-binding WGR domain protein